MCSLDSHACFYLHVLELFEKKKKGCIRVTCYLSLSNRHMLIGKQKSFCGIDSLSVQFNNMCSCMLIDCNLFANT